MKLLKKAAQKVGSTALNLFMHSQILLAFGGLAMVSFGISLIFMPAGVIVGGVSLLLLEWRLSENE